MEHLIACGCEFGRIRIAGRLVRALLRNEMNQG